MKCIICGVNFKISGERRKTCSKICARKYGYSLDSKKRKLLREKEAGK